MNKVFHVSIFLLTKCERGVKGCQPKDHKRLDVSLKYSNLISLGFRNQIDLSIFAYIQSSSYYSHLVNNVR